MALLLSALPTLGALSAMAPPPPAPWAFSCAANTTAYEIATPLRLQGKTVVVTGADGRSGAVLARAAVIAGAEVVLVGRNASRVEATAAAILGDHPYALLQTAAFDLANLTDTRAGGARLLARFPSVDVLINNAGGEMDGVTADGYARMFSVMNIAPALLTTILLPALDRARGRVVNVGSAAGFDPLPPRHTADDMMRYARADPSLPGALGYGVSKFLVVHYTSHLDAWIRARPSPRATGALVVNPGLFRSPPFSLSDELACKAAMRFEPCPQLPEQGAAPIAFAALVDGAGAAPAKERLIDFETRFGPLGLLWTQHGQSCTPRPLPKWDAAEAARWFELVQQVVASALS
jgi:NAD(P)-dependent dehydrogenase (short-subunit alcohol dehydrogenase family)